MQTEPRPDATPLPLAASLASIAALVALCLFLVAPGPASGRPNPVPRAGQDGQNQPRVWHVVARKYAYAPARIEVQQNDLVQVTFETADIPHSFTIDEPYRIARRASPGRPVVFEFRADRPGTFDFYCNLKADDGCRKMRGQLVVKPAK